MNFKHTKYSSWSKCRIENHANCLNCRQEYNVYMTSYIKTQSSFYHWAPRWRSGDTRGRGPTSPRSSPPAPGGRPWPGSPPPHSPEGRCDTPALGTGTASPPAPAPAAASWSSSSSWSPCCSLPGGWPEHHSTAGGVLSKFYGLIFPYLAGVLVKGY